MSIAMTTMRIVFSSTHLITSLFPSTIPSVCFCDVINFLTASIVLFIVYSSTSSSGRAPLSLPLGGRLLSQLKQTLALLKHTAALLPNLFGPLLASGSFPWDQVMMIPFFWSIFMPLIQRTTGSSRRFLGISTLMFRPYSSIWAASFGLYLLVYLKLWMKTPLMPAVIN